MSFQINLPIPLSLSSECRKASRILNSFTDEGRGIDSIIPPNILGDAKGLAIFTVLKAGFLFSGRAGSGIVIARLPDGSWSAPSAIMTGGMGVGGQIGAELTDFIMVLNTTSAVQTFMHHGSITLGGNVSVAAGPIGRNAEASGTASLKTVAAVYSYSKTRGLFAGVSLEGSVILERFDANKKMYGYKVKTRDLLNGAVPQPPAADPLYRSLEIKSGGYRAGGSRYGDWNNSNDPHNNEPTDSHPSFSRKDIHRMAKTGTTRPRGNTFTGNSSSNSSRDASPRPRRSSLGAAASDWPSSSPGYYGSSPQKTIVPRVVPQRGRALYNFTGEQQGDLPFHKGDIVVIVKKTETQNDWWTGELNGREGIFPANFIEIL